MAYDWTKHVSRATIESGGREGALGGQAVYVSKRAPKALRFSSEFYLRWAFDNVIDSLDFENDPDTRDAIFFVLEGLEAVDNVKPFMTVADRQILARYLNGQHPQERLF